jgi:hypothetical protein
MVPTSVVMFRCVINTSAAYVSLSGLPTSALPAIHECTTTDDLSLWLDNGKYSKDLHMKELQPCISTKKRVSVIVCSENNIYINHLNIIYNVLHPSLLLHIRDKLSRNALLILMQEIKRDIIFRKMTLPPSARQITDPQWLVAHLNWPFAASTPISNTSDWQSNASDW